MELRAGLIREIARFCRVNVGDGEKFDGGMLGREARAQPADAARSDYGNAEFLAFDDPLPAVLRVMIRFGGNCSRRMPGARPADHTMLESRHASP
jgi:hypothetical protein